MRSQIFLLLLTLARPLSAAPEITVYAYDSLTGKGSFGAHVKKSAEEKLGIKTNFVPFPTAGEALNQIAIEGAKTRADVVLGVDRAWLGRAREMGHFAEIDAKVFEPISPDLLQAGPKDFVPFEYGYLAFLYDSRRTKAPPVGLSLAELAKLPALKRKVVIPDPRTSSPGLSFLFWTRLAFPTPGNWDNFWKGLSRQLATVSPSWTAGYGMFMKKQADWVLSYTTSPAYHLEEEKLDAIKAVIFPEGHYRQVEGAMVVKSSKNAVLAAKWLTHLLSAEVQEALPKTQWMYPARSGTKLPESFAKLAIPKAIEFPADSIEASRKEWLKAWETLMAARP